jgi:hypothetical protein
MKDIEVFYQVEGTRQIQHLTAPAGELLARVKARIIERHGLAADSQLCSEDVDEPIDESRAIETVATAHGAKLHVHRCARIAVTVSFAGRTVEHAFGPGTTVARVKHWAVDKLGISKEDAGEHVLQIAGTHDRPTPSTHLGALVQCPRCHITFDLVPDERVQG